MRGELLEAHDSMAEQVQAQRMLEQLEVMVLALGLTRSGKPARSVRQRVNQLEAQATGAPERPKAQPATAEQLERLGISVNPKRKRRFRRKD